MADGARYRQRMASATTDADRAQVEWDALRSEARRATNTDDIWPLVVQALRTARTQLAPRRRTP